MISSEVQRTLVKSPPELWTELSDPEALSRHLGELGEIKITRVEPEELVEWEAEGTTGTVAIKPSGWGTKVTLSVNRELTPPPASDDESGADVAEETPEAAEEPVGGHPEGSAETDDAPVEEADAISVAPEQPAAVTLERTPAPATEAARRAKGWPAAVDTGPAIESDLRAAEAAAQEPIETPATWPAADDESDETPAAWGAIGEETDEADDVSDHEQPQPRRGFFARLFGRRRRASADLAPDLTPATLAVRAEPEAPQAENETEAAHENENEPQAEPENDPELETDPQDAPDLQAPSPVVDAPDGELASTSEEPPEDLRLEPTVEHAEELREQPAGAEAPGEEPSAAEPHTAAPEQPSTDLAAELKAAEETAAEEVKAVLTGMLDRLGAAHHRPFSRA